MSIGIVSDSTCYLPATFVAEQAIKLVDVQVVVDGKTYAERDLALEQLASAVRTDKPTSTSRPAPEAFLLAYEELASSGATQIVSVHLSSELSGTYESALIAASRASIPVTVIDSRTIGMAMGFAIMAGAQARSSGADASGIASEIRRVCESTKLWLYVDTLDFLRKGGRIGAVAFRVGGALAVKPLLEVKSGKIEHLESVRTKTKALSRMQELAIARYHQEPSVIGVHHVGAVSQANELAVALRTELGLLDIPITECGAVVATHTGPGALAIVVAAK